MFVQAKIARSVGQAQDIFNKYVYETTDTISQVQEAGYFLACRFAQEDGPDTNGNGWHDGIIEARCSDGYVIGKMNAATGTMTVSIPPSLPIGVLQISVTEPVVPADIVVVGTNDTSLIPPAGYVPVLGKYLPVFVSGTALEASADGLALVMRDTVIYVSAYVDVTHSVGSSTVGVVFFIQRGASIIYSGRAVHERVPNGGDIGNIAGSGMLSALAGDKIGIALASDKSGTVRIRTSSIVLQALS